MHEIDRTVAILGTGSAVPPNRVTNAELRSRVGGFDESSGDFALWVDRVTHIQERPISDPATDAVRDLSVQAARTAIETSGVSPDEIDHVVFASFTYHDLYPGVHAWLCDDLGINGGSFYMTAACSGSLWALTLARSLVQSGQCRNVLVIGTECMTRVMNWNDPLTCVLFSDGAGAAVVGRKSDGEETGFLGKSVLHGEYSNDTIQMWNANVPLDVRIDRDQDPTGERAFVEMHGGPRVLKNAVMRMAKSVCEVLGYEYKDLRRGTPGLRELLDDAMVVPHQANGRILDGLQSKLGVPRDNLYRTVYWLGNCSAATNLVTLDYGLREGNLWREPPPEGAAEMGRVEACGRTIRKGDLVVLTAIGAGYLYGAIAFRQAY